MERYFRVEHVGQLAHPGHGQAYASAHVVPLVAVGCKNASQVFEFEGILKFAALTLHPSSLFLLLLEFIFINFPFSLGAHESLRCLSDESAMVQVNFHPVGAAAGFITMRASVATPLVIVEIVGFKKGRHRVRVDVFPFLPRVVLRSIARPSYFESPFWRPCCPSHC